MHSLRPAATFKIHKSTLEEYLQGPVGHLQAIVTAKGVDNLEPILVKVFSQVSTLAIILVQDRTALTDRLQLKCKRFNSQCYGAWNALKQTYRRSKCRYRNA